MYVYLSKKNYQIKHEPQGTAFDYTITVTNKDQSDVFTYDTIQVDCKSGQKLGSTPVSRNQQNGGVSQEGEIITDPVSQNVKVDKNSIANKFIIFIHYHIEIGTLSYSFVIDSADFMPLEFSMTGSGNVTTTTYNNLTTAYNNAQNPMKSIYENLVFSHDGKKHLMNLDEAFNFIEHSMNESNKKRVMLKKFLEDNFTERGEYVYPKDGNSKCSFHSEYDKGLLKFFAEHGITKIMSTYKNHTPNLGYSQDEDKWYGWSHRAIYGFGVGDKIKKGTCGYEKMKEKNLLNIKTIDQAKEVAKLFSDAVS